MLGLIQVRSFSRGTSAEERLEWHGDPHPILRGRGRGRPDQLDGGWWRADYVPTVGPRGPAGGRRRHQRFRPASRLSQRRLAYPRQVARVPRRWLWLLLIPSVLGGLAGALLLVWTGDRNFTFLVPWLVLGGTVLFVLEPRLSRRSGVAHGYRGLAKAMWPLATAVVFVVAIYGGYFEAGIGILMISALSLLRMGDVHRVVPLKNLLTGCLRGVAVLVLVIDGVIDWGYGCRWPWAASSVVTWEAR